MTFSQFEKLLERTRNLPQEPGCYLMKDKRGKIFYIGKAINLRARVRSYFSGSDDRPFVGWLSRMLTDIETIVVRNDKEALLLEQTLIKQHQPKFNIQLKDDKNYLLLRLDTRQTPPHARLHKRYPKLEIVREAKNDGARYFGPYPQASQARAMVRLIDKHFQLRTCNDHVIDNRAKPCIQYQIGRCPAPCVYPVPDYQEEVKNVVHFLSGQTNELERRLTFAMWQASKDENFERAARLRDQYQAIKTSLESQSVQLVGRHLNHDVIAASRAGSLLVIVRLVAQKGRVLGSNNYFFDHQEFPTEELVASFLTQLYTKLDAKNLPDEVLTRVALEDAMLPMHVRKPTRGKLKALVEIAQKNADIALANKLKQVETQRSALEQLRKTLDLEKVPTTIECFDVSLFQGTDAVASQVCFKDGEPDKSRYRRYKIKTVTGTDDFAMMYEVVSRRLKRGLEAKDLPDLILVDGGKGQLSMALAACKDAGIPVSKSTLYVAGIAKARLKTPLPLSDDPTHTDERLFIPGVKDPIILRKHTSERYLVERIRDEAHRFAITFHRERRKKRTLTSVLDHVLGLGPKGKALLLEHFGTAKSVSEASLEDIAKVPGIGEKRAEQIHLALHKK